MLGKLGSGGRRLALVGAVVGLLLATGAYIGSSNPAGWTCTDTPLRCSFMGNVGIGTTAPNVPLEIANGELFLSSNNGDILFSEVVDLIAWRSNSQVTGTDPALRLWVPPFPPTGMPRFTITNNGNVRIASDSYPIGISLNNTLPGGVGWSIENDGNLLLREHNPSIGPGYPRTKITAGGGRVSILAVDADGSPMTEAKVGIGTTEPANNLTVAGTFYGGTAIGYGISITGARISPACGPDGCPFTESDLKLATEFEGDIVLDTQGGEMRVADGGNVGIGTIDPLTTLDVRGNLGAGSTDGNYVRIEGAAIIADDHQGLETVKLHLLPQGCGSVLLAEYGCSNVGIGTSSPQSTLQVEGNPGYLQIDSLSGAPPAADCDSDEERGRMVLDFGSNRLYVCNGASRGWDYTALSN